MECLSEVEIGPCRNSRFLRPLRLHYTQNGVRKEWDFMKTHDSVSVLIYHPMRDSFVLVKQFRPAFKLIDVFPLAVYACECARQGILPMADAVSMDADPQARVPVQPLPASAGITYELCAGIVDKPGLSLEETAKEEIQEECGYRVPLESLQKITSYRKEINKQHVRNKRKSADTGNPRNTQNAGGTQQGTSTEKSTVDFLGRASFPLPSDF
ncbi:uridine diphosphate glucose pyrophosphatase NUDT14 isoform X5 [Hemitrygon akajei]|uniref:uridine diphosphate glucose pyrophosphatase NUDT14 isoform X5 n=1 Tax=Hemitrygon akajei TaxID=2704970 RepID=UPI003BF96CC5